MNIDLNLFQQKPPKARKSSFWKTILFSMMMILCIAVFIFIFAFNMRVPCELTGGTWDIFPCPPGWSCHLSLEDIYRHPEMLESSGKCVRYTVYSDGGNSCKESSECEGYCLTDTSQSNTIGVCQQNNEQIYWDGGNSCTSSDECKGDCVFIDITQPEKGGTCALNNLQNYQP